MGDDQSIKALQLGSVHIGKIVSVTNGKAHAEDVLTGFTVESGSVVHGRMDGRNVVTLQFEQLGEVTVSHSQEVRVFSR